MMLDFETFDNDVGVWDFW